MTDESIESTGITMVNLSLSNDEDIDYRLNLRVTGMMCQKNCGMLFLQSFLSGIYSFMNLKSLLPF